MTTERVERRLAAILAADVAGYSRLTGLDEEGTHVRLTEHLRSLVDPKIAEHRGRVVKNTGDGLLVEFGSVVDAVRCALDIQRGMAQRNSDVPQEKRIEFRIGINVGDIMIDRGDIFGEGVNVAARLEGVAEPGGICASGRVLEDVQGKLDLVFEDAGEQQLKNIIRPVRVYRVRPDSAPATTRPALALPDRPSIAVLPFQNMSGDPEQDYFADGIVDEIITALSRIRWLFVIARNSSFAYKDSTIDVKQVARELGIRYVLEGSVRKSLSRVRITAQLIDAATGAHLWADRFEGGLGDIFDLQDQVTGSVVSAITPKLQQVEIERAKRKPTESLDSYDYFLRGLAKTGQWNRHANNEALRLFYQAIELDHSYAAAYAAAAWCYVQRKARGWMRDRLQEIAEAARLARRAVHLGRDDAFALSMGGYALAFMVQDLDSGAAFIDRALLLNPNLAIAWTQSGWVRVWRGEFDTAIRHMDHAVRLSPLDPLMHAMCGATAYAHFLGDRYDEAVAWAEKAIRERPSSLLPICVFAASSALAGRLADAENAVARMRQIDPALRVSNLKDLLPLRRSEDFSKFVEGLRQAGLPE